MRPVSATFRAQVVQSHQIVVRVEVLRDGVVQDLPDGSSTLPTIIGGGVTLDATAASRGRLDLSLVDDPALVLAPTTPTSLLNVYGNELRVSRGLVLPDGTVETPTIGVFRIDECDIEDGPAGRTVHITGLDRSAGVIDARFEEPFQVDQGTNVEDAILTVLLPVMPALQWIFPGATSTTPLLVAAEGDDRWAFAQSLAKGCGYDLWFDGDGRLVLAPQPSGAAVASFVEGEGGVLITAGRSWARAGAFNRCVVTGENTGETAPARGVATDTNPLSPTLYGGPFGHVPFFFVSQFITTDAQAADAAMALLRSQLGTTQQVDFGVVVDPSLEPNDIVQITRLAAGINETHIISSLTIPLTVDQPMTGVTRAVLV